MDDKARSITVNLSITSFTILLLLAAFEIFVRLYFHERFAPRPPFTVPSETCGWIVSPKLENTFYGRDFTMEIKTDADGYRLGRLGEIDYSKELIVLCGDSYAFGWGVSTDDTFASSLEYTLYHRSGERLRVVNLGIGGYGTINSAARLSDFVIGHPGAKIAGVLFIHSHNDMVDNVRHIGLAVEGSRPVYSRSAAIRQIVNNSHLHMVNLAKYMIFAVRNRDKVELGAMKRERSGVKDSFADAGSSFEIEKYELPDSFTISGLTFTKKGIGPADSDKETSWRRGSFTPLQSELIKMAVEKVHCLDYGRKISIMHLSIPTMPAWYDDLTSQIVGLARSCGNDVRYLGKSSLDSSEFSGEIYNPHSGGHFTPDFNRFWADTAAEKICEILCGSGPPGD